MTALVVNESVNVDLLDGTAFIGVVSGATTANSSIDGVTWTARTVATSLTWTGVTANGIRAVAVASGSQTTNSSPDGITWTAHTGAMPSAAAWSSVVWGQSLGYFVAVSTTSSTAGAYSTDGITWSSSTLPASANWLSVGYGNGYYVATCGAASTQAAYSNNGTTWTTATLSVSGDWRSVCWGDTGGTGTWVAVSNNSTNATYSTDNGATWNTATLPGAAANWRAVTYGNGRFVAVAFGSTRAAYSTNGISWTEAVLPTSLNWSTIAYSPGLKRFAALAQGSASGCATSPDGIAWTTRTVASATFTSVCASPIRWSSGDTLTINNGSIVTVNTNQTKFWKTITIADGELRIENSSTTVPLVFAMGRNSGATLNAITPSNGLGKITIAGNWIEIGTSTGAANQTFNGKYREHIPYVEVETATAGVYEIWLNVTGGYGANPVYPTDGLAGVSSGDRGKFFTQDVGVSNPIAISLAGGVSTTTKYVTVTSTAGVFPGAAISGTGIPANSVVDEVVSATVLRLNLPTTASAGPNTYTVYNPFAEQFSSTIRFGNGTNGAIPAIGRKIRVPNICITDFTPASLMTTDRTLSAQFTMSNGGRLVADKCYFSESYVLGTQAQQLELTNCGFSIHPLITETYGLVMTNVGVGIMPDRRYFSASTWLTRLLRVGNSLTMNYISNADVNNLCVVVTMPQAFGGNATLSGIITLSFTQNATFNNVRLYAPGSLKNSQYGWYLSDTVLNCTFTNTEVYGVSPVNLIRSNGNVFNGIKSSENMFSKTFSWASTQRLGTSPITDAQLVDDTKYYIKARTFRDWTNPTLYDESRVYSATPYLGADYFHPQQFGVVNTNSSTIVPTWTQRAPTAGTLAYEIYRSQTAGFTTRDRSTRLWSTGTAATVSMNDSGLWNAVASDNGTNFVAVGNNAAVAMSGDGTATWTSRTAISGNWKAVAWNGTNFAAVGNNATTSMTSVVPLGNWTTRTCVTGNWAAIAAGPANQFCAVGHTDGYAMTSADSGVTWTRRECIAGDWAAIAWNGTVYAAVGYNGTTSMTSTDGINWTSRTITSGNWNAIAWNGTYFVAVGNNGTTCTRSTDGINWSSQTITSGNWKSITVTGTTFVAVGANGSTVITSTDGASWTSQTTRGAEKLTTAGWTVNTGWVESPDDNFTHSSGVATLTHSTTIVSGRHYRVTWTITGRTAGSVTISLGGNSYTGITASGSWDLPLSTAATAFTITPTTDFNGTISATSLKESAFFDWSGVAAGSARVVAVGGYNGGLLTMNSTDTGATWNQSIGIAGAATNGWLAAPANKETYYYVLRKYNQRIANPVTNTGVAGGFTITTNQNFNNIATQSVVNCRGVSGSPTVIAVGANFDSLGIVVGMRVNGTGVPANTTVAAVDHYYQITLSNNLTSTFHDSTLTFGLVAGMYVFGTGIGQNARISTIDSDTQITLDVAHEADVSGAINFSVGTESAEQESYCFGTSLTRTNLCLQANDFTNASWTKTSVTAAADVIQAPGEAYVANATLGNIGDRLTATGAGGTVTQSITTVVGQTYTFSVYLTANRTSPQPLTQGTIGLGSATTAFTVSHVWQRFSVTFTAIATSTTATITITTNGQVVLAANAQVEIGSIATAPIATTTAAVSVGRTELSAIQVVSKASAGATRNQGVALSFTAGSGSLWTEFYIDTTANFTPSDSNCFGSTLGASAARISLNTSNNNVFKTFTQVGTAGAPSGLLNLTTASNNTFQTFTFDLNYAGTTGASAILALSNLCNNNSLVRWTLKNVRNNVAAAYPFGGTAGTTNNNSGLILSNINCDTYDLPLNNNYLNVICKGVSGGTLSPLTGSATTAALGTTTDGVALAYTTIYDTIFNELYNGTTLGSLYLTFNASNLDTPPYTVLAGTPRFANSGRLYFSTAGDSVEYVWPHKIIGVTAFRRLMYKTSGVDIGNDATTGFAIKVEYAIDTGAGYGAYKVATPDNLATETLPAATAGFNLKLKLTALANMKYGTRTSKFVVGETINGLVSGATAVIDDDENGAAGTVGTLRLSNITGSFIPGETIRSGATNRATNVATNTSFALGPSFTSYINGLQIFTTVNQAAKYPAETVPLALTGLRNPTEVRVFDAGTTTLITGQENVTGGTFTADIDPTVYTNVDISVLSLGYQNIRYLNQVLGTGLTIPVQQQIDRQYLNP
jgi:hypothetical protein